MTDMTPAIVQAWTAFWELPYRQKDELSLRRKPSRWHGIPHAHKSGIFRSVFGTAHRYCFTCPRLEILREARQPEFFRGR